MKNGGDILKKIKKLLIISAVIYLCIEFIFCERVKLNVIDAFKICTFSLLPSLFPLMIMSNFISITDLKFIFSQIFGLISEKIFHCPKTYAHILFMSLIGGYPVGAIMINSALENDEITVSDAEKLICFCVNCSPAFIINGVGQGILNNTKAGVVIWISELISTILIGNCMKINVKGNMIKNKACKFSYIEGLSESINKSVFSILNIFGYVIGFSAFSAVLSDNILFKKVIDLCYCKFLNNILPYDYFKTFIYSMIEISGGIFKIHNAKIEYISLFAFLTSFGGLGVIFQIKNSFKQKINLKLFIISRFAMGIYSVMITEIIKRFFWKKTVLTIAISNKEAYINSNNVIYTLCMLSMIITILLKREEIE